MRCFKIPSAITFDSDQNFMACNMRIRLSDIDVHRERSRVTSRVLWNLGGMYGSSGTTKSIVSDWTSSNVSREGLSTESALWFREIARSKHTQVQGALETKEKLTREYDYFSLQPIETNRESFADLSEEMADGISSCSPPSADRDRRWSASTSQTLSKSIQTCSDCSDDLQGTKDDDSLPPYDKIVREMFYKFCGISRGSNSRKLQSSDDFKQLLKCLCMGDLWEDFLIWFPKPKGMIGNRGYISLKIFSDLFSGKFAQSVLEKRREYEILCSAIMTMNCLDKKKQNRIEFPQFLRLYRGLYDIEMSVGHVSNVFNKYDIDRSGILTIVDIFSFCSNEDLCLE